MGRQNLAILYGRVTKAPLIQRDDEGNYLYGMAYIDTVRGTRDVDDNVTFVKHDKPLVLSREKNILDQMSTWKENDIVYIKGVITSKKIEKTSLCDACTDEDGKPTKNKTLSNLIYITPIFAERLKGYSTKAEAVDDVIRHQEISNQAFVVATLIRDPKLYTTKSGMQITQYPIAINRKFIIRQDDPTIRTDWPIVKSYGEQALDDKLYLKYQSSVIIDGFLQARNVHRKVKCACCGKTYEWIDHVMELVPYDVEYLSDYRSKEEVEAEHQKSVEEIKQILFQDGYKDELEDDLKSEDITESAATEVNV